MPPSAATPPPPVATVLVGCGAVSRLFYQPALLELARHGVVRPVAVVDPVPAAREALAAALGARACADLPGALSLGAQLAILASPPRFHRAQAEAAFAAGLDVLCEKPLAPTAADAAAIVGSAAAAGRLLAAGHYKRFMPAHQAIKQLIARRTFGALRSLAISEGGKFNWPAATDSFFRPEQTPGGVLLDLGVHVLDLVLWWLGEPAVFAYADDARDGLEANCRLTASFPDGATLDLHLSRDWATTQTYVFRFEHATLHCRVNASNRLELTLDDLPMTFAAELREPLPPRPVPPTAPLETNPQAFVAQLADVCAAVRERREPFVTGAAAIAPVRWIEECYRRRQPLPEPWNQP